MANVNFLYHNIVQALQNTIDSCINSARDRRGYVLKRRFTKVGEITQYNSHYAVQGHSRSPILVPIESSYSTSYWWLILTYFLSCTVAKLWLIIGQIFAGERGVPHFNALAGVIPANIAINDIQLKTRFFDLHFRCRKYKCIFNHFYAILSESYRIRWNYAPARAITPFKVIKGPKFGTNRKLICDFLLVINSNLAPILHRFRDAAFDRSKIAIFGYPSCV